MTNKNKQLFWYGFFANLKRGFGNVFLMLGFISLVFGLLGNGLYIVIGILFFIIGGIFYAKGSSQRFDYQRKSGHIMHGGDGWSR